MIILQIKVGDRSLVHLGKCQPPVARDGDGECNRAVAGQRMETGIRRLIQPVENPHRDEKLEHTRQASRLYHTLGISGLGKARQSLAPDALDLH